MQNSRSVSTGYPDHLFAAGQLVLLLLLAGSALIVLVQPGVLWLQTSATIALTWWLPGLALVGLLRLPEIDQLESLLLASAIGWVWLVVIGLFIHWIPGPVTAISLAIGYGASGLFLWLLLWWRRPAVPLPTPGKVWLKAGILTAFLLLLWLPTLGLREFFHDESTVLIRARDAIRGVADAPARHAKGPGEIIVAMVFYRALGTINEFYARLPFTLAGMGAVLLTLPLGRRLFIPQAGIWAAILMGANGYVLALSRMAQYQGALLLLTVGSALAVWMMVQLRDWRGLAWFLAAVALAGAGLLMHYEFVLLAPMLLVMVWLSQVWVNLPSRLLAVAAGAVVVTGGLDVWVYGQMVTNQYFTQATRFYYRARFQSTGGHNIDDFVNLTTLYNSIYFAVGLFILAILGLFIAWRRYRMAALLLTLWFLPTLLVYFFLIERPGTHYYMIMDSWSLLAALPLALLFCDTSPVRPTLKAVAAAIVTIWLVVSIVYLDIAFLRTEPPYLLEFNERQLPYFPTPYDAEFAAVPRVGIPIDQGWDTLGLLREWGVMDGTYTSNERRTRWYLGDFDRVDADEMPDYFFIAKDVQDPDRAYQPALLDEYVAVGEIRVADEPRIYLYRHSGSDGVYPVYEADGFAQPFRDHVATLGEEPEAVALTADVSFSPALRLVSAGVEKPVVRRGQAAIVVTEWQVLAPIGQNLKFFVHLGEESDGAPLAQWDGFPRMNGARTTDWLPGEQMTDRVLIPLPPGMPPGTHPIFIGFYDAETADRYGAGRVTVGQIEVR